MRKQPSQTAWQGSALGTSYTASLGLSTSKLPIPLSVQRLSSPPLTPDEPNGTLHTRLHLSHTGNPRPHQALSAAIFACLTTTFWACARVGKFTVPPRAGFGPLQHTTPADSHIETGEHGNRVRAFRLPRTKTVPHEVFVFWGFDSGLQIQSWLSATISWSTTRPSMAPSSPSAQPLAIPHSPNYAYSTHSNAQRTKRGLPL